MIYVSFAFRTVRVINFDMVQRIYSKTNILSKTMPAVSAGETLTGVSRNDGYDVIRFFVKRKLILHIKFLDKPAIDHINIQLFSCKFYTYVTFNIVQ